MDKQYDVIVVGAGNGGLVAAATVAKAGYKTLLLEKHNVPGGCASSFIRGRFEFEPSLHELCRVGSEEKRDEIYDIFSSLGADVDWCYENYLFRTICRSDDGWDTKIKAGRKEFASSLEKAAPGNKRAVKKMFKLIRKNGKAVAYITKKKGKPNKLVMLFKHADFMRAASHSVDEVFTALGFTEKARHILNTYWGYLGVPTDELSAFHYLNMYDGYVTPHPAMPHYKSHELSSSLCDVIYKHGGDIWYNTPCTKFITNEKQEVIGVEAGGKTIRAKEVISNIIPSVSFNMIDQKAVSKDDRKLALAREFGISLFTIYLGLDCTEESLGIKDYSTFIANTSSTREQYNTRTNFGYYIVNCLNKVVKDATPDGTCSLFFTFTVENSDIPENLTVREYKKWKNDLALKHIKDYEKFANIDIMSHIEEIEIGTPVTFARFLGTPGGEIYGYKLSKWDNLMVRTASAQKENKIPHLNFCGGSDVRGDGYSSAYVSGSKVATKVINKLSEVQNGTN